MTAILFTLVVDLTLPVAMLRLPQLMGANWPQLLFNMPDAGWFTLSAAVSLLLYGIIKAIIIKDYLRPAKRKQTGEKHTHTS